MSSNTSNSLKALCDPSLLASVVLNDEAAYLSKNIDVRITTDPKALPTCMLASLIFDQLITTPILLAGLNDIFGYSFLEIFGSTIKKLQDAEFVSFKREDYVHPEDQDKLKRVSKFLADIEQSSRIVDSIAQRDHNPLEYSLYESLAYSRFTNLPLISTEMALNPPSLGPAVHEATKQFELLNEILSIELPVLKVNHLDDILDIRQTYGAREFRKVFHNFYRSVESKIYEEEQLPTKDITKEWRRLNQEANDQLIAEFKKEITGWQIIKAGLSVILDIAGFIPGISIITGAISTTKDSSELLDKLAKKRRAKEFAWLCFLAELRNKEGS